MLPQQIQDLKAAVERVASGAASAEDKQLLREAHAAGEVAIASDNSLVNLGTISNSTVIIAKNSTVTYEPGGLARILEILEEEHNPQPRLDRPLIRGSLFYFGTRANQFVGRRRYMEQLRSFLDVDAPFQWWVLTGRAGSGKSRIALEFGIQLKDRWNWGFLPQQNLDWNRWLPHTSTLLIIDYAALMAEKAGQIVETLAHRREKLNKKVRLLLLERSINSIWWDRDFLKSGSRREALLSTLHSPDVLQLDSMSDDELWEIYKQNSRLNEVSPDEHRNTLAILKQIDTQGRPLFAALAGDAKAKGRDIRQWDDEKLLDFHRTETEKRWKPQGVRDQDEALLAFVTMVGGMRVQDVPSIDLRSYLPDEEGFRPEIYQSMVGSPSDEYLAPLEPDILGEYFVLEFLKPKPLSKKKVRDFAHALWQNDTLSGFGYSFIDRALEDFPDKPALALLVEPTQANFSFFWQGAFHQYVMHKAWTDVDTAHKLFDEARPLYSGSLRKLEWLGRAEIAQRLCLRYLTLGRLAEAKTLYQEVQQIADICGSDVIFVGDYKAICAWALADFCVNRKDIVRGLGYFDEMIESIVLIHQSKLAVEMLSKCSRLSLKLMAELYASESPFQETDEYLRKVQRQLGRVRVKARQWSQENDSTEVDSAWWAATNVIVKIYLLKDDLETAFVACLGAINEKSSRISVLNARAEILDKLSVGILRRASKSLFKESFKEEQGQIAESAHFIVQQSLEAIQQFQEGQDRTLPGMWVTALVWSLHPLIRLYCMTGHTDEAENARALLVRTPGLLTSEQQKEIELDERIVDSLVLCATGHALEREWAKLLYSVGEVIEKYSKVRPSFETSLLFAFVVGSSQKLPLSDEDRSALRNLVPVLLNYFDSSGAADHAAAKTGGSRDQKLAMYEWLLEPDGSTDGIVGEASA